MGPLALRGSDNDIWGSTTDSEGYAPDLVSLRGRHSEDLFSRWVTEKLTIKFFECCGYRYKKTHPRFGMVISDDRNALAVTRLISSVFASLLPVASIVALYSVQLMVARLAIIAAFCLVFSLSLLVLTTARVSEVFAATAA